MTCKIGSNWAINIETLEYIVEQYNRGLRNPRNLPFRKIDMENILKTYLSSYEKELIMDLDNTVDIKNIKFIDYISTDLSNNISTLRF